MNKYFLFLLMSFVLTAQAESPTLQLSDFAAYREIETDGNGPLYRLDLVEAIYRKVNRPDLGDLRIFNADGEMVPHTFQVKTNSESVLTNTTAPLSYFPIEGDAVKASGDSEIVLSENSQGKVLHVRLKGADAKSAKSTVRGYLVDLRTQKLPLSQLKISWSSKVQNGITTLDVMKSDDLRSWETVETGVTLAKFAFQGQQLEKNAIDLPNLKTKFLKLSWNQDPKLEINKIEGDFVSGSLVEQKRSPIDVSASSQKEADYFFERPPVVADRVSVVLPETNTIVNISLASRDSVNGSWITRYRGPVYRIQQEGGEISTGPEKVSATTDRYWRMQVEGKEAQLGKQVPVLRFSWVAHQVYFLARGKAPFKMAYGNMKALPADFGFDSLLDSLPKEGDQVKFSAAKLSEKETTIEQKPVVVPPPEVPWKKYALWAALGLALLISAGMAWKLYSELNKSA